MPGDSDTKIEDAARPDGPGALLAQAEEALARGELGPAGQALARLAQVLARERLPADAPPALLGRAMWVAGLLSLATNDEDAFARASQQAVVALRASGARAEAARAAVERAGLLDHAGDLRRVRREGLAGFLPLVERHTARLLDMAAEEAGTEDERWAVVQGERERWPRVLAFLLETRGAPPLSRLVSALALSETESWLLVTLWGLSMAPALARRLRLEGGAGVPAGAVVDATFADGASRQEAMRALLPQGRLRRWYLVRSEEAGAVDPRCERIWLEPDVATFLEGMWRAPEGAGEAVRLWTGDAPAPWPGREEVLARLRGVVDGAVPGAVRVALCGRPGAGKRTLARIVAARLGMPLLLVRPDAVPGDQVRALLGRCQRDAMLLGAMLYIDMGPRRFEAGSMAGMAAEGALLDALADVADVPGGEACCWVLGVPADDAAAVRRGWPDVVELAVAELAPEVQPAVWAAALAAAGAGVPAADVLRAHVCRPGLVAGEMARAAAMIVARAAARGQAAGAPASGPALAEALDAGRMEELAEVAERLWPVAGARAAALAAGWIEVARAARAAGIGAGAGAGAGGLVVRARAGAVVAGARALARELDLALYRLDLGYVCEIADGSALAARWHLERVLAAAARAGAALLVGPVGAITGFARQAVANALGAWLDAPVGLVLLFDEGDGVWPLALESRTDVDMGGDMGFDEGIEP